MMIWAALSLMLLTAAFMGNALRIPPLRIRYQADKPHTIVALEQWLSSLHSDAKFNGTVLLARNGSIVFHRHFGYQDLAQTQPLSDRSSFNLASVSKPFTAMGVLILSHQGKLRLDDEIATYLPELDYLPGIRIEQLLQHTSGLADYMALVRKHWDSGKLLTSADVLALFARHAPGPRFPPGERFEYSNSGYVLLAEIIQRVSAHSYRDFIDSHIFKPLGMTNTTVFNKLSAEPLPHRVMGFKYDSFIRRRKKRLHDLNYLDGVAGDGGIYASAGDLFKWHQALIDGRIIPNDEYLAAYRPAVLNSGARSRYGYGWMINADGSVEHAGGWQGFSSYLQRDLDNHRVIIVLDNSSNALRVTSFGFRFQSIVRNLQYFMGDTGARRDQ